MAVKPVLTVTGSLDKTKTQAMLQSQLNSIGKKLTLTIAYDPKTEAGNKKITDEKRKQEALERKMATLHSQALRMDEKRTASIRSQADIARRGMSDLIRRNSLDQTSLRTQEQKLDIMRRQAQLQLNSLSGRKGIDQGALSSISSTMGGLTVGGGGINEMRNINQQIRELGASANTTATGFGNLARTMGHNILKMIEWGVAGALIFGTLAKIKDAFTTIIQFDKYLAEIRMASGMTKNETSSLTDEYIRLGKELGISSLIVAKSAADLYRQGLSTAEVNIQMEQYIKLSRVLGEDLQKTIELGTSASKVFETSVQHVGDVSSAVGDALASSGSEIMQIIQKSGSMAKVAGLSIEQLASIGGIVVATTRESGSQVGNSLKNIFAKLQQIDELTGQTNEDYGKTIDRIARFGVSVEDGNGQMLGAMQILKNLGERWSTLTTQQQKYIASGFGVHQLNRFTVTLQAMTGQALEYNRVLGIANMSTGQMDKKYQEYSGTIEASIARMKVSWEALFAQTLSSDAVNGLVKIGGAMVDLIKVTHLVEIAIVALGIAITRLVAKSFMGLITTISTVIANMVQFVTSMALGTLGVNSMAMAFGTLTIAMGVVGVALMAVNAIYAGYNKGVAEATKETDAFKVAQEELNGVLSIGDKTSDKKIEQIKALAREYETTKKVIDDMESGEVVAPMEDYLKAEKAMDSVTAKLRAMGFNYEDVAGIMEKYNNIKEQQIRDENVVTASMSGFVTKLGQTTSNYELLTSALAEANENGFIGAKTTEALEEAYVGFTDITKLSTSAMIAYINTKKEQTKEDISNNIKQTESLIANTEIRMQALDTELKKRQEIFKAEGLGSWEGVKSAVVGVFSKAQLDIGNKSLDDLRVKLGGLQQASSEIALITENANKKKDKKEKSTDILDQYKQHTTDIKARASAITVLETQSNLYAEGSKERLNIQAGIITGYENQQKGLKKYDEAIKATLSKGGLKPEEIEKLNDTLRSNNEQWWALTGSIKTVYDSQKKYNDELKKESEETAKQIAKDQAELNAQIEKDTESLYESLAKALEKQEEKKSEIRKDAIDENIKNVEAELDALTDAYNKFNDDLDKDDINKKIEKLTQERLMRSVEGSLDANARIYEIDEELIELNKDLSDKLRKEKYDSDKKTLDNKKKSLEEEKKAEEKALTKFKEDRVAYSNALIMIQNNQMQTIIDIMKTYDDAFANDGKLKGQAWLDNFMAKVAQATQYVASTTGGSVPTGIVDVTPDDQMGPNNDTIRQDMLANSKAWHLATPEGKKALEAENERLGKLIGGTKTGGKWDVLTYHDGIESGMVGNMPIPKRYEQLSLLAKGEGVFNRPQMDNLSKAISPSNRGMGGSQINISNLIGNISATLSSTQDINQVSKQLARTTQAELLKLGVRF